MRKLLLLAALSALSTFAFALPAISYTNLGNGCVNNDRVLSGVIISDMSGVPTSGANVPRVYFRKGLLGAWVSQPGTQTDGNQYYGTWSFTITAAALGGFSVGDTVQYYVIAESLDATPQVSSRPSGVTATGVNSVTAHPAVPASYKIGANMNGTYTVGAGGDYATLAAAINAYNSACLSGPVVFSLTDATYSVSGTLIIENSTASAATPLTIKPAAGNSAIVQSSGANMIQIASSYVTIDGNNGAADKQLTFAKAAAAPQGIIQILSTYSQPLVVVSNITIQNAILINGNSTGSAIALIDRNDPNGNGYFRNIKVLNNTIQRGSWGVLARTLNGGGAGDLHGTGIEIRNNDLSSSGADAVKNIGIYVRGSDGAVIRDNKIGNFNSSDDQDDIGVWLDVGAKNTVVERNQIDNLGYTGSSFWSGTGIYISSAITGSGIKVYNNFISNIGGRGANGFMKGNPIGICVQGPQDGIELVHNSIRMAGSTLYQVKAVSIGIALFDGKASVINNIIVNDLGLDPGAGTGSFSPRGTVGIYASISSIQFTSISNNNYWVSPTGTGLKAIGYIANTEFTDLASWQTASGETSPSNILPLFTSASDLHLLTSGNALLNNRGKPSSITTDIDGDTRSASTPDVGADEFSVSCISTVITTQPLTQTVCNGASLNLSVAATGTGLTYQWRRDGNNIFGATGASFTVASAESATHNGVYDVVITSACSSQVTSNTATVTVTPIPTANVQPSNDEVCAGSNYTLTASSGQAGVSYQWQKDYQDISGATSTTLTLNNFSAGSLGSYRVKFTNSCGHISYSDSARLSLVQPVAITSQPQGQTVCSGATVNLAVTATGSGLTYQWRKDGVNISPATSASYSVTNITAASTGSYDVVVSGTCTPALTSVAAVIGLSTTNNWLGTVSSDWSNAANWCLGVPGVNSNVTVPSGTPFSPAISSLVSVNNLTIANGATVTVAGGVSIYGVLTNTGTLNASAGSIGFKASTVQTVSSMNIKTVVVDGAGIILGGNMTTTSISLVNGHVTLGNYDLSYANVTGGNLSTHIITNGSGKVILTSVGTVNVFAPVSVDAATFTPVQIENGGGRNFAVSVASGINPAINLSNKAINRTWTITPSAASSTNASITLQYNEAQANSGFVTGTTVEVGIHNGTAWNIASGNGIMPVNAAGSKVVGFQTSTFGAMVIASPGGLTYPTAVSSVNGDITSMLLLPNIVRGNTVLRLESRMNGKINFVVTDAYGRKLKTFHKSISRGRNDLGISLSNLLPGVYYITGSSSRGTVGTVKFIIE